MNSLNARQSKIIEVLQARSEPISSKTLSLLLNVSVRTIKTEISHINDEDNIITSTHQGYLLTHNSMDSPLIVDTSDEYLVLKELILSDDPLQIDELAEAHYMSRTTFEKKLKKYQHVLTEFDLLIHRKNSYLQVIGTEINKRKLLNYLIFKETDPAFSHLDTLEEFFPEIDVEKIESIVLNSIHKYNYSIGDVYENNLMINIIIALYRLKFNHSVDEKITVSIDPETVEYKIANEICTQYANHWRIVPSKDDIVYFATLLYGQIKPNEKTNQIFSKKVLTREFLKKIDEILKETFDYYLLSIDYSDFLYNFALHIDGMIKRAQSNNPANNVALKNLKKNCPFIHDVAVHIAQQISEEFHVQVVDSEIGFISIHIGYLTENSRRNVNRLNVLLVGDDYHHIMDHLKMQLSKNFSDFVNVNEVRTPEQNAGLWHVADLILTTKVLPLGDSRVIMISPFYTFQDHMKVSKEIQDRFNQKKNNQLNGLFSQYFKKDLFFMENRQMSKDETIEFLGHKMVEQEIVEKDFIDSVKQRESLSSTCFFETFAVPHAINLNAKKTTCAILLNEKGIQWNDHLIFIVLMIAIKQSDRKQFMNLYDGIVQTFENPTIVHHLLSMKDYEHFIDYLKNEWVPQ